MRSRPAWRRCRITPCRSTRERSTPRSSVSKGWIKGTWQKTENNRDAKYYALTKTGERALSKQTERWRRLAGLVDKLLLES
jgi:DNA-binding PadR family transcriptional regulator